MQVLLGSAAALGVTQGATGCSSRTENRAHRADVDDDDDSPSRSALPMRPPTTLAPTQTPTPNHSYMVVDMLPPPSRCAKEAAQTVTARAMFVRDREVSIRVTPVPTGLTTSDLTRIRYIGVDGTPTTALSAQSLEIKATANTNLNNVLVITIPVSCPSTGRGQIVVTVDWTHQGTSPNVLLTTSVRADGDF
ncbi:MAG: hypothetical protein U0271_11975 [Polyangiaceae bacterium]